MRDRPTARPPGRLLRRLTLARGAAVSDAGFGLVEVMVAMFILVSLALATTPFFVHALADTADQSQRQSAVTLATQRIEMVRSVGTSTLLRGRTASDVASRLTSDPGAVDLSNDDTGNSTAHPNSDPTSTDPLSSLAEIPVLTTTTLSNHTYTVRTYINPCYRSSADGTCTKDSTHGQAIFRVTVDISWPRPPGDSCRSGRPGFCEYDLVSLRDPSADPLFNSNVSAPVFDVTPYVTHSPAQTGDNPPPIVPTTTLHPLIGNFDTLTTVGGGAAEQITLNGKNFLTPATVTSSDPNDVFQPITSNTGTSATMIFQPSASTGNRVIRLTNSTDGGNDSTVLAINNSAPTITGVTAGAVVHGQSVTVTLTGTDFYTSSVTPASVSVTINHTSGGPNVTTTLVATGANKAVTSTTSTTFKITIPSTFPTGSASSTIVLTNPDGVTATLANIATTVA